MSRRLDVVDYIVEMLYMHVSLVLIFGRKLE